MMLRIMYVDQIIHTCTFFITINFVLLKALKMLMSFGFLVKV